MSEMSLNRPGPGKEDVLGYPDPDHEANPHEAVFIGTEGERPEEAMGDVTEDMEGEQVFEEELLD